jgi:catechol 2,3-dioxygenase-like lactoylglutathione lyase family enzyme
MAIQLDHTIIPAHDNEASAKFFARIFGLSYDGRHGHFAPVRVNDSLTLDFDTDTDFKPGHYAFKVSDAEFEIIFGRIKDDGVVYGSSPGAPDNMKTYEHRGGRGFYFRDPAGHLMELLTY